MDYDRYRAVDGVSFEALPGEVVGLVGPNGSGKSTVIKCVSGILRPSAGKVLLDGRDLASMSLREVAGRIAYVPQSIPNGYFMTVMDTVLLGRKPHIGWGVTAKDLAAVQEAMEAMGLGSLADKPLGKLSGGERQRVVIARALAQQPHAFLFDEPTNNLDLRHQMDVLETSRRLAHEEGKPVVIALHDLNLAYSYSDRVVMLQRGKVFAAGRPGDVLTAGHIREVYEVDVYVLEGRGSRIIVPLPSKKAVPA
jgi:iron complex transport system ATP-binding protein